MIQKVHVLQKDFYEKKQDGTYYTYKTKDGVEKKYKNVKLVLDGNRIAYGGAFDAKQEERIKAFNPDAEVELDLETVEGKTYLKWKFPKTGGQYATIAQFTQLVTRIEELEQFMHEVKVGKKLWTETKDNEFNLDEIDSDEIPF